jgi:hypothetical protein
VATLAAPAPVPAPSLTDVTGQVRVFVRRVGGRPRRGVSRHQVIIANIGRTALNGPLWLALGGLDPSVVLVQPGQRRAAGRPGGTLVALPVNRLNPRRSVSVMLTFAGPLGRPVRFGIRVLDGIPG